MEDSWAEGGPLVSERQNDQSSRLFYIIRARKKRFPNSSSWYYDFGSKCALA
jgi:hypothetical protein